MLLPLIGYVLFACLRAAQTGYDLFYSLNEARLIMVLLIVSASSFRVDSKIRNLFNMDGIGILPILFILVAGLTRGFGGIYMPIYFGLLVTLLYWPWISQYYGIPGLFFGSGTVATASLAAANYHRALTINRRTLFAIIFLSAGLAAAVFYQIAIRGRSLNMQELDRVQLHLMFFYVMHNANWSQILYGFGPALDFWPLVPETGLPILQWLQDSSGVDGLYSYLFHSDHLRIILNFGVVYWVGFQLFLYKCMNRDHFILLFIAGLTNSVLLTPTIMIALLLRQIADYNSRQIKSAERN